MNIFRYSLAELFLLMAYCAVVVWCFQFNWMVGMLCLGAFIGVESGRKTKYAIFLMIPAGLMMAAVFVVAINGVIGVRMGPDQSIVNLLEQRLARTGQRSPVIVTLDVMMWIFAFGSLAWFVHAWSTVKNVSDSSEQGSIMRAELESIVKEKREAIKYGPALKTKSLDAVD